MKKPVFSKVRANRYSNTQAFFTEKKALFQFDVKASKLSENSVFLLFYFWPKISIKSARVGKNWYFPCRKVTGPCRHPMRW